MKYLIERCSTILLSVPALVMLAAVCGCEDDPCPGGSTQLAFVGADHQEATRLAVRGYLMPETVEQLVSCSTVGDTDEEASCRSRSHFDNCSWEQSRAWIDRNLEAAIEHAGRYHRGGRRADRDQVFRSLGFVIHATQDFYAHSNWVETREPGTIADFSGHSTADWVSGTCRGMCDDATGEPRPRCPAGTPTHDQMGLDRGDRPGFPGSFDEAFGGAVAATIEQLGRFVDGVHCSSGDEADSTLRQLGFEPVQ